MTLESKEHYDLMAQFEAGFKTKPTREAKEFWKHSVYCDGYINRDFLKYREGYSLAKSIYQSQLDNEALDLLKTAVLRADVANEEGNPVLSAWANEARTFIRQQDPTF